MKKSKLLILMLVIIATSSFFIKKTHLKTNEMLVGEGSTESDSMSVTKVSKTSFDRFILNDKNTRVEYKPFTINIPEDWKLNVKKEVGNSKTLPSEEIVLTRDEDSITISRRAFGGQLCYENKPYSIPLTIQGLNEPIMKNFELNKLDNRYIICEIGKEGEYDGPTNSHLTITSIGEISISYTGEELLNKDSEIVKIIETIVVSY